MKSYVYITLCLAYILLNAASFARAAYCQAITPHTSQHSDKEYPNADNVYQGIQEGKYEKPKQAKRNFGWNFNRWYEARRKEAKLLPANERRQYLKQANVKLIDSILDIRRFSFESNTGAQFGNISKHYLRGSLKLYDSIVSCSFERPLLFWSKQFDYKVVSRDDKKTEIEIFVHGASTLERSTIQVSQIPYKFLIKLTIYPNREAELAVYSIDVKSTHLRSYGTIEPLGDEVF